MKKAIVAVAGLVGAVVATLAMCGPTAVLAYFLCRVWDRFKDAGWRAVVAAGLAPISVGLIAASAVVLTIATSINVPACLVVLATAAMTYWTRWSPLWAIAAGALLGLAGLI